jgi:hypothetical protein
MKTMTMTVALLVGVSIAQAKDEGAHGIEGWYVAGPAEDARDFRVTDYEGGLDQNVKHGGEASAFLRSTVAKPAEHAVVMQSLRADDYRGKCLRVSAWVKTEKVADAAGLWLKVVPAADQAVARVTVPVRGTTGWKRYDVVLDVPPCARSIVYGLYLQGAGKAWIDDMVWEVVEEPTKPSNAKFEPAEQTARPLIATNRDISYISAAGGVGSIEALLFEARFVAPFGFYRPWGSAVLSMEAVLRMYREPSDPVKTPSFMPGITLATPRLWNTAFALTPRHHSNGQAGDFYENPGDPPATRKINHQDGSFATNFFEFALLSDALRRVPLSHYALDFWGRLAFEWHPGFGQEDEIRGDGCSSGPYGNCRVNVSLDVTLRSKLLWIVEAENRLRLDYTLILGALDVPAMETYGDHPGRHIISATYVWKPVAEGNDFGLFLNVYRGQDYYNIYFDRELVVLRGGLAAYPFNML